MKSFLFSLLMALGFFMQVPSLCADVAPANSISTGPVPGSLAQAATALLQPELNNVTSLMISIATNPDSDAIYISALRVELRRSLAALTIYRALLPEEDFQWVKQQLTQLRIATDTLSDDDALEQILIEKFPCCGGNYPFGNFQDERSKDQQPLLTFIAVLQKDNLFKNRVDQMLQHVAWPAESGQEPAASELIKKNLLICLADTFQPLPTPETSYVELHQFRIRIKKLRYMIELLENIFPPENYNAIYSPLVLLQSVLGNIHDLFNLEQRVEEKISNPAGLDPTLLAQVLTRDEELLGQAHQDFFLSYTPAFFEQLQNQIKATINLL